MQIKNLKKAATRIKKAIKAKERIILYGDADLDGVTSVIILQEAIKNLGGEVARVYFPDREMEGYGITKSALQSFKKLSPALIVAMDLGITNFEEIDLARSLGFQVVLVDHHEIVEKLPKANIIVDPKQKGDTYPFKLMAACGLTFRLAQELLKPHASPNVQKSLVELACLGTIADMMPREEDNLEIVQEGLAQLPSSWRPGIRSFLESDEVKDRVSIGDKASYIISVLNVRDIEDGLPAAYRILCMQSLEEANLLRVDLEKKNRIRHETIDQIVAKIEGAIKEEEPLIFYGDSSFDYVLLGAAASILSKRYRKPTFLYKEKGQDCMGSVRAPHGYDTVKAMYSCKELLVTFGGHPPASGFRLRKKNLKKFKESLSTYFTS